VSPGAQFCMPHTQLHERQSCALKVAVVKVEGGCTTSPVVHNVWCVRPLGDESSMESW